MSREININRQLLGLEDILFGTGIVTQIRAGQTVNITRINAGNLPFDETRTLLQWAESVNVEALGSMITELQAIYDNLTVIGNIEDNLPVINNLYNNIVVLQSLYTNISKLQNIDANMLKLQNIDTNMTKLQNIYTNMSKLQAIYLDLTKLESLYDNLTMLAAIYNNLTALNNINSQVIPNLTELLLVNDNAAQVAADKLTVAADKGIVAGYKNDVSVMKVAVETIYDTFDDRFLGVKNSDPTVDNDENALLDGAMYFNGPLHVLKVYSLTNTAWYAIPQIYLSGLLDVQLTSIATGDLLTWNGTKWVNTRTPSFDSVKLNGGTSTQGTATWNNTDLTYDLVLNDNVTLQVGQEEVVYCKNNTLTTLPNGRPVMAVGTNGNSGNILVELHDGAKASAKRIIGLTTQPILPSNNINPYGFVTRNGKVRGLNTTGSDYGETWVDGDILYVKATGALTKVEPADTSLKMPIAFVIHAHTNGTLYVRTTGIDENHDRDLIATKVAKVASTDNAIVRFEGVTGDLQNSATTIDDNGNIGSGTQSFNGFGGSGFKNYLINGNFNVWQRGTSFNAVGYCADRWHLAIGGSANGMKHNTSPNTILLTTTAASSFANLYQAIETATVIGLRGKTLTLSLKLQTGGTYTGGFALTARYSNSTDTLNSQTTTIQSLGISASSTNTRYSLTFTVPADAVGLRIDIENTSVQPSGALYQVQEVQLEIGSIATPFENRPYGLELSMCQRYFFIGGTASSGVFASASTARFNVKLPCEMRVSPSVTPILAPIILNSTVSEAQTGSQTLNFGVTGYAASVRHAVGQIQFGGFSSGVDGRPSVLLNDALSFSAEL